MCSSMHSWPLGGERFISVSGIEGCGEVTSLVEWLTRGHRRDVKDIILISKETFNTRSTNVGKDKCYDKIKNQLPLHNSEWRTSECVLS